MNADTARLLVSDYGPPKGAAHAVSGKPNVFAREFTTATVTLDCNDFSASFAATGGGTGGGI